MVIIDTVINTLLGIEWPDILPVCIVLRGTMLLFLVGLFFLSRSESGAPCVRGMHSSNNHCVAVYCPISRIFFCLLVTNKQTKLETKASSHEGQCIPAGSNISPPRLMLLSMSIITMLFPANSASVCLRFAKSRQQFCEFCGATYRRICEVFSALQSTSTKISSESGAPCVPGSHSSNKHCVAVYCQISTRFSAFFENGLLF